MMVSSIATKERQVQLDLLLSKNPHYQLSPEELVRRTLQSGEGELSDTGALIVNTGAFTGRSPKDKFIVKDNITTDTVDWNNFNIPISTEHFRKIYEGMVEYLESIPELYVRDCYACADPRYRLKIRVINEKPWDTAD